MEGHIPLDVDGTRGPRTSSASSSRTTGLACPGLGSRLPSHDLATGVLLIDVAFSYVCMALLLACAVYAGTAVVAPAALEAFHSSLESALLVPPYNASSFRAYSFDTTLGFPGEGPPTEVPDELLSKDVEMWLDEIEEEKRLIESLPVVQKVGFIVGETANLSKVKAILLCCWAGDRFKTIAESCTEDSRKPTHLEAARALREKITREHCCVGHQHHPRAVARREALSSDAPAGDRLPSEPRTARYRRSDHRLGSGLLVRLCTRAAAFEPHTKTQVQTVVGYPRAVCAEFRLFACVGAS